MNISKINKRGFSLIEVIVAMFVSTVIILSVTAAFASAFRAQKKAREVQKSIEEAKASLELMAKIIRMSSNIKVEGAQSGTGKNVYMYNKSTEKCVQFEFADNKITEKYCDPSSSDNPCGSNNIAAVDCFGGASGIKIIDITRDSLSSAGFFIPSYSFSDPIKRVAIRMEMKEDSNAKLQTTVSARDYQNLNPIED